MEEDYYILHTGCCSREAAYVFKLLLIAPFTDFVVLNRNENPAESGYTCAGCQH